MSDKTTLSTLLTGELRLPWLITLGTGLLLLGYGLLAYGYGSGWQAEFAWAEGRLINLRTICYWAAILTLPLTNLVRHIQLRLNQTMPTPTPAKSRYAFTVLVSMLFCSSIGLYGLMLFGLGDGLNTFIIFIGIAALGMCLYRPKRREYESIVAALAEKRG